MVSVRWLILLLLTVAPLTTKAQTLPELTGRVVDQAGILSAETEHGLTERLLAHEKATSNQVVVVTLGSLQGYSIEQFGVALGRHWQIGQEGRDNGVVLLVAPNERKVRIEVGYGLEGILTDAVASSIIRNEILPRFRNRDMAGGIRAGADMILHAIDGTYQPLPEAQDAPSLERIGFGLFLSIVFLVFVIMSLRREAAAGWGKRRRSGWQYYDGYGGGSGGGGGFSGGGFSGGGGSFGGGGSSGSW